jgi:low temperature requirement protein LtrA
VRRRSTAPGPPESVSTLELFFDLVFVFAVTQLTSLVVGQPNIAGVLRAALILFALGWMYGGYAWLTNAVPPRDTVTRLLLLVGMAAFLVVALSIPAAFGDDGIAFGIAYLVVNLVHLGLFLYASEDRTVQATLRLAPFNLLSAGLILVAGFVRGPADWVLWTTAVTLMWLTPYLTRVSLFSINTRHFVERHGLVVIIALGESVVAVGIGAAGQTVTVQLAAAAVLGLSLSAALWWVYFDGDDERAEQALEAVEPSRRPRKAVTAFGYCFMPLLGGIVLLAAGVKQAVAHIDLPLGASGAWFLAGGVGLFLVGEALFRAQLGISPVLPRAAAGFLALATVPFGVYVAAEAQMVALLAVVVVLLVLEPTGRVRDGAPIGSPA